MMSVVEQVALTPRRVSGQLFDLLLLFVVLGIVTTLIVSINSGGSSFSALVCPAGQQLSGDINVPTCQ